MSEPHTQLSGQLHSHKTGWVKENEPELFEKIYKIMLPGDYVAMRLTDRICTTVSGLSEMMLWDFKEGKVADFLLEYFGYDADIIPEIVPTFSVQGPCERGSRSRARSRPRESPSATVPATSPTTLCRSTCSTPVKLLLQQEHPE